MGATKFENAEWHLSAVCAKIVDMKTTCPYSHMSIEPFESPQYRSTHCALPPWPQRTFCNWLRRKTENTRAS